MIGRCDTVSQIFHRSQITHISHNVLQRFHFLCFLPCPKSSYWKGAGLHEILRKHDRIKKNLNFLRSASVFLVSLGVCRHSSALLVSSGRVCLAPKVCWDVDSTLQVDSVLRKQRLVTILALN